MNKGKKIVGLTLLLLLGNGVSVAADFSKGLQAAQSGDFKTSLMGESQLFFISVVVL